MRKPDLTIGNPPQTLRWHLFRVCGIQVALHKWMLSDNDRALHDHSAGNISILLWGSYREVFSHAWEPLRMRLRIPLIPYFRRAETSHRVLLHRGAPVWTLWIRFRPRRHWGFTCPERGWIPWEEYVKERDYSVPGSTSTVGSGCG